MDSSVEHARIEEMKKQLAAGHVKDPERVKEIEKEIEEGTIALHKLKDGSLVVEHTDQHQLDTKHGQVDLTERGPFPHDSDALQPRFEMADKKEHHHHHLFGHEKKD